MNNNNFLQVIQQGFRITIGATASLVETIQDPQKRTKTLSQLQLELEQKTKEWAQKGEVTEQEARRIIDDLLSQRGWKTQTDTTTNSTQSSSTRNYPESTVQSGLEELTQQIITLREELEKLRKSED
ncbi:MAG: hypothetical protein AB4368_21005 [Xenococcaceae cyanobacterium]